MKYSRAIQQQVLQMRSKEHVISVWHLVILQTAKLKNGVKATVIAKDGIAVIVNKDSKVDELTSAQVKDIYTGKTTKWADIK